MGARSAVLGILVAVVGCRGEPPTGSNEPVVPKLEPPRTSVDAVARIPALVAHARLAASPVARPGSFRAGIAETANEAVKLGVEPGVWVEVRLADAAAVPATVDKGVRVHERALPGADLLRLDEGGRVEDLVVLRDESAPSTVRWHVRRGPGITKLRLREGFVEALDARGVSRLRAEPMVAYDAAGKEVPVQVSLEGDVLAATIVHAGLAHPVVLDPAWGPTTAMAITRANFQLIALDKGRQIALGGLMVGGASTSTAEIYDPTTGSWTLAKSMSTTRAFFGGVGLKDGKVLAIGGYNGVSLTSVEVYDATADAWTAKASLPETSGRGFCDAVRFSDTKVLVAGGVSGGVGLNSVLIYDVTGDKWSTATGNMQNANNGSEKTTPVLLASGDVLLVEGYWGVTSLYSPTLDTVTPVAPMVNYLTGMLATRLLDGRVFAIGDHLESVQVYDPKTDKWSARDKALGAAESAAVQLLSDGRVLVAGGWNPSIGYVTSSATYEPAGDKWTAAGSMVAPRTCARTFVRPDGGVVAVGGSSVSACWVAGTTSALRTVELYGSGLSVGALCSAGGACTSGNCVDGVCCDRACTGACESCNVTGSVGTCKLLTGDPPIGRTPCAGSGTCKGTCDGTASACVYPKTLCTAGGCTGGVETPAASCDGAGTCPAVTAKVCSPFACGAVACKTTCTSSTDCATGRVCESGACVAKHDRGEACADAGACASPFVCVDGVCCDKACDGKCESCKLSGSVGVCSPIDGALDEENKCGTGPCVDVCKAGKCSYKVGAAGCGAASCTDGVLSTGGSCDGTGATCTGASSKVECPGLVNCADDKTCRAPKCGADVDCAGGRRCDLVTGTCSLPPLPDAGVDGGDAGVDAGDAGPADVAIAESGAPDTGPKPAVGGEFKRCIQGSECPSGFCVEGVCCDTACTGRCHSCALLTSPGKCALSPIGVDLRSECGPALSCLGTCDGNGQCIGSGKGSMCGRNRCTTGSTGVGPAYCAGPGAKCPTDDAVAFDCSPYACEAAFGACVTTCVTSNDCARGFDCDTATRACVPPAAPPADSGGCAVSAPGRDLPISIGALLLAGLLTRRRRGIPR